MNKKQKQNFLRNFLTGGGGPPYIPPLSIARLLKITPGDIFLQTISIGSVGKWVDSPYNASGTIAELAM
jgi:hypothetical protein